LDLSIFLERVLLRMQPLQSIETGLLQQLLAQNSLALEQSIDIQLALAQDPSTPREILEILVNQADAVVSESASQHINWASELTGGWRSEINQILESAQLGQNDRLAVELLKIGPVPPQLLSKWVPATYLLEGLRNPHMPLHYRLQLLERLAQESTLEPRLQVVESSETPAGVIEQLLGDLELPIRLAAKVNSNCPPDLIKLYEGHESMASDWNTDQEQLAFLGKSRWAKVRLAVAQNPSAGQEILMQLANDSCYPIQLAVAQNPLAGQEVLRQFANDSCDTIQLAVAQNIATPENILHLLASHPKHNIQAAVAQHLNATEEIFHQLFPIQKSILRNLKNLPVSLIQRFFDERDTSIPLWKDCDLHSLAIWQQNTMPSILTQLINSAEIILPHKIDYSDASINNLVGLLVRIVNHPNLTEEHLNKLSEHSDEELQLLVAQHLLTKIEVKKRLLKNLCENSHPSIQVKIASDLNTPQEILELMAQRESGLSQLLNEIRRVIISDYPLNARSYEAYYDEIMSKLKHELFTPVGYFVEVDRWMTLIGRTDLLACMMNTSDNQISFHFAKILPKLNESSLSKFAEVFCGILTEISKSVSSSKHINTSIELISNPNTPKHLREILTSQIQTRQFTSRKYYPASGMIEEEGRLLVALANNHQVPDNERQSYFQILTNEPSGRLLLAKESRTPASILEKIFANDPQPSLIESLAKNPSTPGHILQQIGENSQEIFWYAIIKNPNTPLSVLQHYAQQDPKSFGINYTRNDLIVEYPKVSNLDNYRFTLWKVQEKEIQKANEILARRPNSPYALAQILERGDQKAKIIAARNSQTPIAVLRQLAKDSDDTVRHLVSQNPNLPHSDLIVLASDSIPTVRSAIASQKIPLEIQNRIFEELSDDEDASVRTALGRNPNAPAHILEKLAGDSEYIVRSWLSGNPNLPVSAIERLEMEFSMIVSRNTNTPGHILAHAVNRLLGDYRQTDPRWSSLESTHKELHEIIKHPVKGSQMPSSILDRLADHHYPSIRYRVAQHPNTSTNALEKLANDDYIPTIRAVVDNPNTPPNVLERLAKSSDLTTRLSIVRNPNTPVIVLADIVQNSVMSGNAPNKTLDGLKSACPGTQYDVLREIAVNVHIPLATLEILARREFISAPSDPNSIFPPQNDDIVVKALVYNPTLTTRVLNILAQDPCVDVRLALIQHPNLTPELWLHLAGDDAVSVRCAVATSQQVPTEVFDLLTSDSNEEVKQLLAANQKTPAHILHQLAQDVDLNVRSAIAANPNTSIEVLEQLSEDEKIEVRRSIAQNPNTPASIREKLRDLIVVSGRSQVSLTLRSLPRIFDPKNDDLPSLLSEYIQSDNQFVRFITLLHPLTSIEILENGAKSQSWLERYAVADNPSVPAEIRQHLTQDGHRIVRAAAYENI
jgi:hypothetical protein